MREKESVEQFMNRRFQIIDEEQTIGDARRMLNAGYRILLVAQKQKPVYVMDNSKIAGEKASELIKNIEERLDKIVTVSSRTDLRSVKRELSEKTAIVVCDDDKKTIMGTLSVYDL